MEYDEFLQTKEITHIYSGLDIDESEMNKEMFPFQKFCVRKALRAGKYALFADTGLGKTFMQLEWAQKVAERENKPILILAPLAVTGQTILEGERFGYSVSEIRDDKIEIKDNGIYITNYESIEKIDTSVFCGIVLDESSILKNFDGKTKEKIILSFQYTPYKLACTATPSPNDVMELCNHAEFLDVMNRNEMLAMYFVHDGGETTKWRIKGHAEKEFWNFVSTWAIMITTPSDIGFSDEGYILPPLNVEEIFIETPQRENGMLFNDMAVSATTFNQELRSTKDYRLEKVVEIAKSSDENFIIWIGHDDEGAYLKKHISDAIEVKGSDDRSYKKEKLLGFAKGEFRVLITKLKIASMGLNYQNCHNQIFASLDFSFEKTYQGMRRSYRFGQTHQVNCYLIVTDTMQNVRQSIMHKQYKFLNMQKQMSKATNRNINAKRKFKTKSTNYQIELPSWINTFQKTQQFTGEIV